MRKCLTVTTLILLASLPALGQTKEAPAQPAPDEQALRDLDRQSLEASIKGDRKFLEALLADTMIGTGASGRLTPREEILKNYQPPPPDLKFSLAREDVRVHLYGDAAVVSGRTVGTVQAGGQTIKVNERTTDTYVRRDGRWRLVASHTSDLPPERAVAKVDPKVYDAYAGEYQITPLLALVVTSEGGRLMAQPRNQGQPGTKSELLPKDETTFFQKDSTEEIVFVRGEGGKVTHLVSRFGGQELKAAKIK